MQIEQEDYDKCIAYTTRNAKGGKAPFAWELSYRFGPRVSGCARITAEDVYLDVNGRFGFGQIRFCEKGNRERMVDIRTVEDRDFIENLIKANSKGEPLIGIKDGSINRALNRTLTALGLKSKYPKTSIHGLRKLYAGRCWDDNCANGLTYMENVMYVNKQLGHGVLRNVRLLKVYVTHMEKY